MDDLEGNELVVIVVNGDHKVQAGITIIPNKKEKEKKKKKKKKGTASEQGILGGRVGGGRHYRL